MAVLVLVVDDHPLVREGLAQLLSRAGIQVVGQAEDGKEGIRQAEELRPDVVLWDILMPSGGFSGVRRLLTRVPETKVLLLTALEEPGLAEEAQRVGAHGIVPKTARPEELVNAVLAVAQGQPLLTPHPSLTAREEEVLGFLAQGLRTGEIAERLQISPKTVETHLEHLREKLGCASVPELRAWALRHGK